MKKYFIAIIFVLVSFPAHAAVFATYFNFRAEDTVYRIAVIRDARPYTDDYDEGGPMNRKAALKLAARAQDWTIAQFKKEYPGYSTADFDKLDSMALDDPRTVRVVAMNQDGTIVGNLLLVYDDHKRPLPYDTVLGRFPRTKPHFGPFTRYDIMTWGFETQSEYTGSAVQAMEFVVDPTARGDLNAVLLFASEWDLLQYVAQLPTVKLARWKFPSGTSRLNFLGMYKPGNRFSENMILVPEDYILYCDVRMAGYYQRLGFEIVKKKGNLLGMRIKREDFVKISSESPFFRRAYNKLDSVGLELEWQGEHRGIYYPPGADIHRHGETIKERIRRKSAEYQRSIGLACPEELDPQAD